MPFTNSFLKSSYILKMSDKKLKQEIEQYHLSIHKLRSIAPDDRAMDILKDSLAILIRERRRRVGNTISDRH